jgi:hypothetical protein
VDSRGGLGVEEVHALGHILGDLDALLPRQLVVRVVQVRVEVS